MPTFVPIILILIAGFLGITNVKKNLPPKKIAISPTPTLSTTNSPTSTVIPTPTTKPQPTIFQNSTQDNNSENEDYIYPGAKILTNSQSGISLESTDNPNKITDWYKDRIKSNGMNTTSFVTTNTNGNIENVLVGAKNGLSIKITINKSSENVKTLINIEKNS